VIGLSHRPLPDKAQHSQEADIHASGGIRTRNHSNRAAVGLRLRLRGHCYRMIANFSRNTQPWFTPVTEDNLMFYSSRKLVFSFINLNKFSFQLFQQVQK